MGDQPELFSTNIPPWELDAQNECRAAAVVFSEPPHGPFHYLIPDSMADVVVTGMRLRVPLGRGNREMIGYCTAVETLNQPRETLKAILEVIDPIPLCTGNLFRLVQWMSKYYIVPLGQVLEAVVPAGVRTSAGSRQRVVLSPAPLADDGAKLEMLSPKQREVLQFLKTAGAPLTVEQLQQMASCSPHPIQQLRKNGFILSTTERVYEQPEKSIKVASQLPPALSVDQRHALLTIQAAIESRQHQTILLHGITGSGKTEVYMQAIEQIISFGRQAIVLVPEISLTPQSRQRFQSRFGNVSVLHSHMSPTERHFQWRRIAAGEVSVIVGPRSAIFAPVPHLGLVILDEEHENSFKQDTIPRYHARDVALQRTYIEGVPLILGSATPSLESWQRAQQGKYQLVKLPRRIHNRPLPEVTLIDMRAERHDPQRGSISRPLYQAVKETLTAGGQTILLLNRRGFATTIQCPQCGHVVTCPNCDLPLTHHQDGSKASCHYCDHTIPTPPQCPECKHAGIRYSGTGTQRLELEVQTRFPGVVFERMDSDTMRKPGSHERVLTRFKNGEIQILLGTQMIAKGLDFPNVLMVGVINADSALHFPDFRSAERTFQLVTQVAGRTGRGEKLGQVIVQTYSPEHFAIAAAAKHDFISFAAQELKNREQMNYPPFGSMARIIVRGEDVQQTQMQAQGIISTLKKQQTLLGTSCRLLGPAPPPIARLRGKYRFHCILQADQAEQLNRLLTKTLAELKPNKEVQWVVDIDPLDML